MAMAWRAQAYRKSTYRYRRGSNTAPRIGARTRRRYAARLRNTSIRTHHMRRMRAVPLSSRAARYLLSRCDTVTLSRRCRVVSRCVPVRTRSVFLLRIAARKTSIAPRRCLILIGARAARTRRKHRAALASSPAIALDILSRTAVTFVPVRRVAIAHRDNNIAAHSCERARFVCTRISR